MVFKLWLVENEKVSFEVGTVNTGTISQKCNMVYIYYSSMFSTFFEHMYPEYLI